MASRLLGQQHQALLLARPLPAAAAHAAGPGRATQALQMVKVSADRETKHRTCPWLLRPKAVPAPGAGVPLAPFTCIGLAKRLAHGALGFVARVEAPVGILDGTLQAHEAAHRLLLAQLGIMALLVAMLLSS